MTCIVLIQVVVAKSHYMYASRRSINVPSISSIEHIYEILEAPFAPCSLKKLLERRFGITQDMIPDTIFRAKLILIQK